MRMRRCVSFMEITFLKPSAVLFTSVFMGHVDIVVFSASDLTVRHPFKPQFVWFESLRLSTQIIQLCRDGSSWVDPELNKD